MNQKEQAMLAECRERVLACGFPDLDVLGWALKLTPVLDEGGACTVFESIFISPQVLPLHCHQSFANERKSSSQWMFFSPDEMRMP